MRTHVIDAVTGAKIAMADIKSIRKLGSASPLPDRTHKPFHPASESDETGLTCRSGVGGARTAENMPKPDTPESELGLIAKHLTVQNGTVTFGSVPRDVSARWRNDGKNIREELERAGYIKNCWLTPKGASWLRSHGCGAPSVNPYYYDLIGEKPGEP